MTPEETRQQSENAYNQWCVQWREYAKHHSKYPQKSLSDFRYSGMGKAVLCVANGRSFQDNIETIKENQNKVDILCCDKTLGHLLDNGITPTFCVVCDANVSYEKYMEKYKDQLQNTILFGNVCGNPKWADNGNWKDVYFFVNKDIIRSEREFSSLSGCQNQIPAATNVSNAMIVFLTQCDESGFKNFFGYDKILLIGFDYSWRENEYYAFDDEAGGKSRYMKHIYVLDGEGQLAYTSANLQFSLRWLETYIRAYGLPVVQCTRRTLLSSITKGDLKEQMQYNFQREDSEKIRDLITIKDNLVKNLRQIDQSLSKIARDHQYNFLATT